MSIYATKSQYIELIMLPVGTGGGGFGVAIFFGLHVKSVCD